MVTEYIYYYYYYEKTSEQKAGKKAKKEREVIGNGEIRMRVYDGDGRGVFKWVFAGNAHIIFNEGVLRDRASMELGNFDYIVQATRRNKINEKENRRNNSEAKGKMVL